MLMLILFGLAGFVAICVGAMGFTKEGISLSSNTKIAGAAGMVLGIGCILVGLVCWFVALARTGVLR